MAWVVAVALLLMQAADPSAEGLKALDEQRWADAAQAFETAVKADGDDYAAHFNLAFAYSMLGRADEAIAGYRKTLELKPGLAAAELNLGMLLLERHEAAEAVPHLKAAAEAKPNDFRVAYSLAQALYETADDAGAEQAFRRAAEINPKAPEALIGLGRAVFNQGRYEEAEPFYRQAAELDPQYRDYLIELGARYEEKGENERAIAIYRDFSDRPEVEERLGHLLLQAGRIDEALPHLENAVAKSPTVANRYALVTAYIKKGEPDKALPMVQLAIQEAPDNYELHMIEGRLLRDRRQFMPAAQAFVDALQVRPDSPEAWKELAAMLIQIEDYPKALAALDRVEALGDAPVSVHFFRGLIWDKMRNPENALASYQRFLELSHDQYPDEEFKARQRILILKREIRR